MLLALEVIFCTNLFLLLFNIPNIGSLFWVHIGYNEGLKAGTKFEKMDNGEKVFQKLHRFTGYWRYDCIYGVGKSWTNNRQR